MLSAKLKARADDTYQDLDYSGSQKKTRSNNCFIIQCFEIYTDKYTVAWNQFDIALGNHALRAQPADSS